MSEHNQSLRIVVGMPGSGKTTYLQRLLSEGIVDSFYDDYQKGAPEEDKSNPRLSPNYPSLCTDIAQGKNVAITDIRYCDNTEANLVSEAMRTDLPEAAIIYTYFANDPEACKHNVRLRNRPEYTELELQNIDKFSVLYNPPKNQTIPVIMG